jgi:hypothetical protein
MEAMTSELELEFEEEAYRGPSTYVHSIPSHSVYLSSGIPTPHTTSVPSVRGTHLRNCDGVISFLALQVRSGVIESFPLYVL